MSNPRTCARRHRTTNHRGIHCIYSIVCTCGLLGIEPWAYLKDVLQRLAEGEDPAALTPRTWKEARTS